jgi:hypothetical protein
MESAEPFFKVRLTGLVASPYVAWYSSASFDNSINASVEVFVAGKSVNLVI